MSEGRFGNRRAVVVGGTSGVGRSVARGLVAEGASVAVCGPDRRAGQDLVAEIRATGGVAMYVDLDATDDQAVDSAFRNIQSEFGKIDILYNNAGKVIVKPFSDTSQSEWHDLWSVNVMTMVNTIKSVLPFMIKQGGGSIVNMASISALTASPLESAYCTTKGACLQLTRSIAVEYRALKIRCNAICPGFIRTTHGLNELAAFSEQGASVTDAELKSLQLRIAEPDEIAGAVLFLASDAASFVNGECLVIDNGAIART